MPQSDEILSEEISFTAHFDEYSVVYIGMTLKGLNLFLEKLDKFSRKRELIISEKDLISNVFFEGRQSVSHMIIKFSRVRSENLIVNLCMKRLHIFTSEKGILMLTARLNCLKRYLENGRSEDVSLTTPEWGGHWLLNKRIIKNSNIVSLMRLFAAA